MGFNGHLTEFHGIYWDWMGFNVAGGISPSTNGGLIEYNYITNLVTNA